MTILHLHLLLNHLPVIGTAFLVLLFGVALIRRDASLARLGLVFAVALAAITVAVYFTGLGTEDAAEKIAGVTERSISEHEEAAEISTIAFSIMGVLALGALALSRKKPISRATMVMAFAATLIVSGMLAWTANLGGQIRHTELRTATASVGTAPDD